ncbi:plasmid recombination protein [Paracoccus sp. (in: a-proteobacteria)]|uniref:plasmid recombination protein n=1 Tax=Paracoccus sp. TaxID=267 RepID=UPI002AFE97FA|nr:plasmid recombination protein [Paracoccus sp. (in: a-proteobacteria)]
MSNPSGKAIFAHTQTYSLKGNSKSRSAGDTAAEGERLDGACPHVQNPQPPTILEGMRPMEVVSLIERRMAEQNKLLRQLRKKQPDRKDELRSIRKDTHVLIASIFSFPDTVAEMVEEEYLRWRDDVIAFAKDDAACNGAEVMSIFEHRDESHPHLHIFAVPLCTDVNMRMNAKLCHDGHRAQDQHMQNGLHGSPSRSYRRAMRGWQDRYHEAVGSRHNQARTGPRRRRLDRAAWRAEVERLGAQKKTDQALRREAEAAQAADAAEARHLAALEISVTKLIEEAELAHVIAEEGLIAALHHQNVDPDLIQQLAATPTMPPRNYSPEERAEMRPVLRPTISDGIERLRQPPEAGDTAAGFGMMFEQIADWMGALNACRPRWLYWGDLGQEIGVEARAAFRLQYVPSTLAQAIEQSPAWTGLVEQARTGLSRAFGVRDRLIGLANRWRTGNQ